MAELIKQFTKTCTGAFDTRYVIRAYGSMRNDGTWDGWLEFHPLSVSDETIRGNRETLQPDRTALASWAAGLGSSDLERAFQRTLVRH